MIIIVPSSAGFSEALPGWAKETNTASSVGYLAKGRRTTKKLKPFRAADHPHQDFRGQKIVNGVKWRV